MKHIASWSSNVANFIWQTIIVQYHALTLISKQNDSQKKLENQIRYGERSSNVIYSFIQSKHDVIFDFGCGLTGDIWKNLYFKKGCKKIILSDIQEQSNPRIDGIPFIASKNEIDAEWISKVKKEMSNSYGVETADYIIISTVLHHTDPKMFLETLKLLMGKNTRLIIIEDDFNTSIGKISAIAACCCLNNESPLDHPMNFKTPKQWKELFEKCGLKVDSEVPFQGRFTRLRAYCLSL